MEADRIATMGHGRHHIALPISVLRNATIARSDMVKGKTLDPQAITRISRTTGGLVLEEDLNGLDEAGLEEG